MKTAVYEFFPELSTEEVDRMLSSVDFSTIVQNFEDELREAASLSSLEQPQINLRAPEDFTVYFDSEPVPFFAATWSLAALSLADIKQVIRKRGYSYAEHAITANFVKGLLGHLQQILLRAQLDFVDRHFPSAAGEEEERSYEDIAQLLAESTKDFAHEFEVAAFVAAEVAKIQLRYLDEILTHLNQDRKRLEAWGIPCEYKVRELKLGLGDSHSGRSVAMIEFDHGEKVLYKPRSLQAEVGCSLFLDKVSSLCGWQYLASCPVIDCGDYGWAKYIEDESETRYSNPTAVAEFACFLKLLAFSDVHFENVHFNAGIPILIDAETVLTAGLQPKTLTVDPVHQYVARLITSTGLFPSPLIIEKKNSETFIDVGVLGLRDGSTIRERQLVIREAFTNKMHVVYENVSKTFESSVPETPPDENFIMRVSSEYSELLSRALMHIETLAAAIRDSFKLTNTRVVLQDTIRYRNALHLSGNQHCLSGAPSYLAALCRSMLQRPDLPRSIQQYELQALTVKDIPRYSVRCNQEVLQGDGKVLLKNYYECSPIDECIQYLASLSLEDLELESWLIRVSFAPYLREETNLTGFDFGSSTKGEDIDHQINADMWRALRQLELGYYHSGADQPATWVGARLSQHAYQYWYVDELALDLYAGSVGVASPLSLVGDKLGINIEHYFENLHQRLAELSDKELALLEPGAISGCHSVLWALSNYYSDRKNEAGLVALRQLALRMLKQRPQVLDFTSGLAGLVALANQLGVLDRTDLVEELIVKLRSITSPSAEEDVLTGYAHGIAGYIASLSMIDPGLGYRDEIEEVLDKLLAQLLSIASSDEVLWPISSRDQRQGRGWCSGTPGILLALAQLDSSPYRVAVKLDEMIQTLIEEVKANTFGGNPSLCHGDVGNLWVLEHVATLIGDQDLIFETRAAGKKWLREHFADYVDSLSRSAVSHGLFVGTGGACLYALHLLYPNMDVRCPLWLG